MEPEGGGSPSILNKLLSNAQQFQMELQQIYSNPHLDSQCLSVQQRTDCQAVDFSSQWMVSQAGGIPGVPNQFSQNSKQFQMELWQIYSDPHVKS